MGEPLPLHRVHAAIFDFCRDRPGLVIFGAQAVNSYVRDPRMTQDVDIFSATPKETAGELAHALHDELELAAREVKAGVAYRVYQKRSDGPRHLADVRLSELDPSEAVARDGVRYVPPDLLVAMKVTAWTRRRLAPKGGTDLADIRRLLLARPELREQPERVGQRLRVMGASEDAMQAWDELRAAPLVSDEDVDEGY